VARDRQRAKQRRARRAAQQPGEPEGNRLHRENVPGQLDHASGQVDEFEATLIANSGGEPVSEDFEAEVGDADDLDAQVALEDEDDATDTPAAVPSVAARGRPAEPRGGNRAMAFLRASWAELQRVQWPDRRQVAQATAVVIGFLVVAGAYLGVADKAAEEIVKFIL
jgi:preprotein translocase SecE subunit